MAEPAKKYPPSHAERAKRLEAAFDVYLKGMNLLKKERKALMEKFMSRVDGAKIENIKKLIDTL